MEITIERAGSQHLNFVHDTWAKSFRKSPQHKRRPASAFYPWHRERAHRIFVAPDTRFYVALDRDQPDFIVGWLCSGASHGGFVLHYAYVRSNGFQRQGVFTALLRHAVHASGETAAAYFTHTTVRFLDAWLESKGFVCRTDIVSGTRNIRNPTPASARLRPAHR